MRQTPAAKRQATPPTGYVAGAVMVAILTLDLSKTGYAVGDKIEFGPLPSDARPIRMSVLAEGMGTPNITLGFLAGEPGDEDTARVLTPDFLNAVALVNNTAVNVGLKPLLDVKPIEGHRAIGATLSAAVARGAGKKLTLVVEYVH